MINQVPLAGAGEDQVAGAAHSGLKLLLSVVGTCKYDAQVSPGVNEGKSLVKYLTLGICIYKSVCNKANISSRLINLLIIKKDI